jgi:plastocyanin
MILAPQAQHPPARVQVVAQEFSYSLSRTKVRAGRVIVEFVNRGQDTHDLDVRRIGGTRIFRFPSLQPGQVVDRELKLVPGRYLLWCAIADHREQGMHAMLRVARSKPAR